MYLSCETKCTTTRVLQLPVQPSAGSSVMCMFNRFHTNALICLRADCAACTSTLAESQLHSASKESASSISSPCPSWQVLPCLHTSRLPLLGCRPCQKCPPIPAQGKIQLSGPYSEYQIDQILKADAEGKGQVRFKRLMTCLLVVTLDRKTAIYRQALRSSV